MSEVILDSWNGKNEGRFMKALSEILLPVLSSKIFLHVPHKNTAPPEHDGDFHVWIWSACENTSKIKPPSRIEGISVSCRDDAIAPTVFGNPIISTEGWTIGELIDDDNLYIFHDICHEGDMNEEKLFRWCLEQTVEKIMLMRSASLKAEDGKGIFINPKISTNTAPNGMTRTELFKDIHSVLDPAKAEELKLIERLRQVYAGFKEFKSLYGYVENNFNRYMKGKSSLINAEAVIAVEHALRLKIDVHSLLQLAQTCSSQSNTFDASVAIYDYAAKNHVFASAKDYLLLYTNVHSARQFNEVRKSIKKSIFEILTKNRTDLPEYYGVFKQFSSELPEEFLYDLKELAKSVFASADLKSMMMAKEILGSETTPEMDSIIAKTEEYHWRRIYGNIPSLDRLYIVIKRNHETENIFSDTHISQIVLAFTRLEIDFSRSLKSKSVLSGHNYNSLLKRFMQEKLFTKLYEIMEIRNNIISREQNTKEVLDAAFVLFTEAWQRQFDSLSSPAAFAFILKIKFDSELFPLLSKIIVACAARFKFTLSALGRLLKKNGHKQLLNCVISELLRQGYVKDWKSIMILDKLIALDAYGSGEARTALEQAVVAGNLLDKKNTLAELADILQVFSGNVPQKIMAELEESLKCADTEKDAACLVRIYEALDSAGMTMPKTLEKLVFASYVEEYKRKSAGKNMKALTKFINTSFHGRVQMEAAMAATIDTCAAKGLSFAVINELLSETSDHEKRNELIFASLEKGLSLDQSSYFKIREAFCSSHYNSEKTMKALDAVSKKIKRAA